MIGDVLDEKRDFPIGTPVRARWRFSSCPQKGDPMRYVEAGTRGRTTAAPRWEHDPHIGEKCFLRVRWDNGYESDVVSWLLIIEPS